MVSAHSSLVCFAFAFTLLARVAAAEGESAGLGLLDAVKLALENDPNILLVESRLESAEGALLSSSGQFDLSLDAGLTQAETRTPLAAGGSQLTESVDTNVGLSQLLRSGLSLSSQVGLTRDSQDSATAVDQASVSFTVRQPLMRGRGEQATAVNEIRSRFAAQAAAFDLAQTIAIRLRSVSAQYWATKEAQLDLAVLTITEQRSRELLETTRRLIAADLTPAAEMVQLEADLTAKEAARIGGERTLFEARQNLGQEIGLDHFAIRQLPLPVEEFPQVTAEAAPPIESAFEWIDLAFTHRADLRAAKERLASADAALLAAENTLQPQLDLVFTPSYSGRTEGGSLSDYFGALNRNVPGLSASLGIDFSWPIFNRAARGSLIQAQAGRQQLALDVTLTQRSIGAQVPAALDAVTRSVAQLERASQAVRLFEQAVQNEEKKLKAGSSTLLDVISQRDRLTSAQRREVVARRTLALALLDLRFETGTLFIADSPRSDIRIENLTALPF